MPPPHDPEKTPPKIGAGHLQAFARQGLNELRNAVYSDSNIAQKYPEPGLYGTATQAEVGQQRLAEPQVQLGAEPTPEAPAPQPASPAQETRLQEQPDLDR